MLEHPFNAEVHYMLGISYLKTGDLPHADGVFAHAAGLTDEYDDVIGIEYKNAAVIALRKNRIDSAAHLFEAALRFNPDISRQEQSAFYLALGEKSGNDKYYAKSLERAGGDTRKQDKIKKIMTRPPAQKDTDTRYMHIGAGVNTKPVKPRTHKAALTVKLTNRLKTVIEKTFSFRDAYEKKYGQIKALRFGNDDIQVGDRIEISTTLSNGGKFKGKEIGIWNGDRDRQKWTRTEKGHYTETVTDIRDRNFIISLAKRKDIKVTLKVKRRPAPPTGTKKN